MIQANFIDYGLERNKKNKKQKQVFKKFNIT